ncbi:RICIN domain-containing protein [Streptomyces wuyuanensis]|uniref:Ricin-type beta-trefoil lectin domain-containing protein n=1 Tax=Streptomyces wuyuanensis TaxID=1196353 RepID=A0A1G9N472_9ACTN|nr:RICIN domain-containing protein [Streptomyces wuyuanensis]SDL81280.1 Ricin-type beta-trefoil lectin domain-containing protein [Streptomyces wuyuanensis]
MPRIARSVLSLGAGLAVLAAGATVASADEPPTAAAAAVSTTAVQLRAEHSGKCLTITKGSLRNGADAVQSACAGDAANQRFDMAATGAGTFELRAGHSGKCLEVAGKDSKPGSVVQQYWCGQGQHQQWRLVMVDIAEQLYELRPAHLAQSMNRCLDVKSAAKEDGASSQLWACNGTAAQKWRIQPVTAA